MGAAWGEWSLGRSQLSMNAVEAVHGYIPTDDAESLTPKL